MQCFKSAFEFAQTYLQNTWSTKVTAIFAYSDNAVADQKNKFALHEFTKIKESTGIPTMYFQNASYHNKWAFD